MRNWEQYQDMMNQFLNLNDSVSVVNIKDGDAVVIEQCIKCRIIKKVEIKG